MKTTVFFILFFAAEPVLARGWGDPSGVSGLISLVAAVVCLIVWLFNRGDGYDQAWKKVEPFAFGLTLIWAFGIMGFTFSKIAFYPAFWGGMALVAGFAFGAWFLSILAGLLPKKKVVNPVLDMRVATEPGEDEKAEIRRKGELALAASAARRK